MEHADLVSHWRNEAEKHVELAAVLFRKGQYRRMLHHCHLAVKSTLTASLVTAHQSAALDTVNLVVLAEGLHRSWNPGERDLLVELTEFARAMADDGRSREFQCTKETCSRHLTVAAGLVSALR